MSNPLSVVHGVKDSIAGFWQFWDMNPALSGHKGLGQPLLKAHSEMGLSLEGQD